MNQSEMYEVVGRQTVQILMMQKKMTELAGELMAAKSELENAKKAMADKVMMSEGNP